MRCYKPVLIFKHYLDIRDWDVYKYLHKLLDNVIINIDVSPYGSVMPKQNTKLFKIRVQEYPQQCVTNNSKGTTCSLGCSKIGTNNRTKYNRRVSHLAKYRRHEFFTNEWFSQTSRHISPLTGCAARDGLLWTTPKEAMVMSEKVGAIKTSGATSTTSSTIQWRGGGAISCSRGDPSCGEDGGH